MAAPISLWVVGGKKLKENGGGMSGNAAPIRACEERRMRYEFLFYKNKIFLIILLAHHY